MSLWTPDGEHEVNKQQQSTTAEADEEIQDIPGFEDLTLRPPAWSWTTLPG